MNARGILPAPPSLVGYVLIIFEGKGGVPLVLSRGTLVISGRRLEYLLILSRRGVPPGPVWGELSIMHCNITHNAMGTPPFPH